MINFCEFLPLKVNVTHKCVAVYSLLEMSFIIAILVPMMRVVSFARIVSCMISMKDTL